MREQGAVKYTCDLCDKTDSIKTNLKTVKPDGWIGNRKVDICDKCVARFMYELDRINALSGSQQTRFDELEAEQALALHSVLSSLCEDWLRKELEIPDEDFTNDDDDEEPDDYDEDDDEDDDDTEEEPDEEE